MGFAFHRNALEAFMLVNFGKILVEHIVDVREHNLVLRALRPGKAGLHARHVEFKGRGEHRLDRRIDPETLFLGISLGQRDRLFAAAGKAHIIERLIVDAEKAAGCAIFGRHIGKRRAVGKCQRGKARAIIFDEAAHHAMRAQHLGRGQHKVGRGDAFGQRTGQFETDHFGDQHRYRLAQHRGLCLDAAHAPAQNAQAVDHRGVTVGADAGIGICDGRAIGIG